MPKPAPATSNWKAVEDRQPPGVRLTVTGVVTTTRSNQEPQLTNKVPQGINPAILLLDLTITTSGDVGNDVIGKREVRYREEIRAGQYTSVEILYDGQQIVKIEPIEVVH